MTAAPGMAGSVDASHAPSSFRSLNTYAVTVPMALGAELGGSLDTLGPALGTTVGFVDRLGTSVGTPDGPAETLGDVLGPVVGSVDRVGIWETLGMCEGSLVGLVETLGPIDTLGCPVPSRLG
eukprot:CAMPEP_0181085652 /NCGR_PEP_ID=MMETSP1071-20121207/5340_1 /TAXON_ID=35127 /ORGANISM="Thalassiosira sp., Strain NH16" /LENGTH=122 /DNA_ID=CAMNT_0023167461 /DNA_START=291 /DNA_END=655 /DNA_ORIENTATION=+